MIYFFKKTIALYQTSSKGLTQEQVDLLHNIEVGDRLAFNQLKKELITDPDFKLEVVKKKVV